MFSQSDVTKYPLPGKRYRKMTLVDKADEIVDIRDIMSDMGLWAPSGEYYSYKIFCPWHVEHSDQLDKNCRIFPPTNIYCWAMHGYITPTYLYSRWKAIPREKAAEILLDERGILNRPWRERWNELIEERETDRGLGSKEEIIAAFHTALARVPEYDTYEFHPIVRQRWAIVLEYLDRLWEKPGVGLDTLDEFFNVSLTALTRAAKMAAEQETT